jgi:dCTP deaminase
LDCKLINNIKHLTIDDHGYLLKPNTIYLAKTKEKTYTNKFVPMIEGRSSIGRLGIFVHTTAGFGDVGFDGFWTLEISVIQPIKIYPNIRIAQVYYHSIQGDFDLYEGKYQYNNGIQKSKLYEDFI